MKKILAGLAICAALVGVAFAQGALRTSPVVVGGAFSFIGPTQSAVVPANGGTFTCTGGGVIAVSNTNVTANSVFLFGLKTVGGTVAQPFVSVVTAGSGFSATCGGSDTSVYNYIVLG